jgi:hypothetical protein
MCPCALTKLCMQPREHPARLPCAFKKRLGHEMVRTNDEDGKALCRNCTGNWQGCALAHVRPADRDGKCLLIFLKGENLSSR